MLKCASKLLDTADFVLRDAILRQLSSGFVLPTKYAFIRFLESRLAGAESWAVATYVGHDAVASGGVRR